MSENTAESQAAAQVASIVAMVAALNVDYDRFEELRESRSEYGGGIAATTEEQWLQWGSEFPDDAEELAALAAAAGENTSEDEAREAITEDALSVEVRSGWASSKEEFEPEEFRIVLCTGGPHVELVGDLSGGTPSRVRVLYREWSTSGEYFPSSDEREALETYCTQFYFGE